MSQNELACVGKFVIALIAYFLVTGLVGALLSEDSPENIPAGGWVVGGIMFAVLAMYV